MKLSLSALSLILLPIAVRADVTLYTVSGTTETAVPSVYSFGQVALGDTKDVLFRARNNTTADVVISKLAMSGNGGFAIVSAASIPFTLSPGSALDFTVRFTAASLTTYQANLQVNTITVLLVASVIQAPNVSVSSPCSGPDSQNNISFGKAQPNTSVSCIVSLTNPFTSPINVAPISVSGAGFATTQASLATIPAGQAVAFTVVFTPSAPGTFPGSLTAGVRGYTLVGTGLTPSLPTPILTFDTGNVLSNEQHTLTMRLPSPAPVAASGSVTISFIPSVGNASDDSAIQFVAIGKRVMPFTVAQGSTAVLLNGQPNAIFSTGTTAGKITFTVDAGAAGMTGDPTVSLTIAPSPVTVSSSGATRVANNLQIAVTAFDNTYSAGLMSFSFFDRNGYAIGSPIAANFTSDFQNFFKAQGSGSSFLMRLTFPVTGDATLIGGVQVSLTNTAGSTKTAMLNFP